MKLACSPYKTCASSYKMHSDLLKAKTVLQHRLMFDDPCCESVMRTTLSIDDDVWMAAKAVAEREHRTIGEVLSSFACQGLKCDASAGGVRNGIRLLPTQASASPVTLELVHQLRDELPG